MVTYLGLENTSFDPIEIYSIYIPHEKIINIWSRFDELRKIRNYVSHPTQIQHAFVLGASRTGKSTLALEYMKRNPPIYTEEQLIRKVAYCEVPQKYTESELYESILESLQVPKLKSRYTIGELKRRVVEHLKNQCVELLFLDELQHILRGAVKPIIAMDTLKHIANISNVVLVCLGNPSVDQLRKSDLQYKTRFEPIPLHRFKEFDKSYCELLYNIQKKLKYNRVALYNPNTGIPQVIHKKTLGLIGITINLLYHALKIAYSNVNESSKLYGNIDLDVIEAASEILQSGRGDDELIEGLTIDLIDNFELR